MPADEILHQKTDVFLAPEREIMANAGCHEKMNLFALRFSPLEKLVHQREHFIVRTGELRTR